MAKKAAPSRPAAKPAARKRARSEPAGGESSIPKLLFAQASPHSMGGIRASAFSFIARLASVY